MQRLTGRQEQFCLEYIIDLNATKAAIRAGYSHNTAKEIGYENLTKPHIQKRISELKKSRLLRLCEKRKASSEELEVTADRILKELAAIAFADPGDFLDIVDGEFRIKPNAIIGPKAGIIRRLGILKNSGAASDSVIVLDFQNKMKALSLLMEHFGMVRTSASQPPPLKVTVVSTYSPHQDKQDF